MLGLEKEFWKWMRDNKGAPELEIEVSEFYSVVKEFGAVQYEVDRSKLEWKKALVLLDGIYFMMKGAEITPSQAVLILRKVESELLKSAKL